MIDVADVACIVSEFVDAETIGVFGTAMLKLIADANVSDKNLLAFFILKIPPFNE